MKKKISVATTLVLILFAILLTFQITYTFLEKEYQKKVDILTQKQSDFSQLVGVEQLVRENFNGTLDEQALEAGLIRGYLSALGDRYSRYLTPSEYRTYLAREQFVGSGIGARFALGTEKNEVVVYDIYPDSPAAQGGIRRGDVLLEVEGKRVEELGFSDAVAALSGESGTSVSLKVRRTVAAQELLLDFSLVRASVAEATVSFEVLPEKIGYVQIFEIGETTATEFEDAVRSLQNSDVNCLIFDIRNASGEDLESACNMMDLILSEGVVMIQKNQNGETLEVESDAACVSLPISVLMNSATTCAVCVLN